MDELPYAAARSPAGRRRTILAGLGLTGGGAHSDAISGDYTPSIMAWSAHGDTAAANVWAIPADILQAGLAAALLIIYRGLHGAAPGLRRDAPRGAHQGTVRPR